MVLRGCFRHFFCGCFFLFPAQHIQGGVDYNPVNPCGQVVLIPYLSAIENVRIVLHGKNNRNEIRNNLLSILPDDSLDMPVSSLSGGMKRRVALARALSYPGKLIILDEPFTGLDKDTKLNVIDYILKMRNNRTLLIATHGTDDANLLGAEIIKLNKNIN